MSTQISPAAIFQSFLPNGQFNAGGKVFTYAAGTTTPQATFTDSTGATPNPNPVILNAMGEAAIWLTPTQAYKYVVQDSQGNPLYTTDNINGALSSTSASLTSLVVGTPPAGTQAVVINGNTTDSALIINTTLAAGVAVQVNGNVNQSLALQLVNPNAGNHAGADFSCGDASGNAAFMEFQGAGSIAEEGGGVSGLAVNIGSSSAIPLQICTNDTVRATVNGTTGAWSFVTAISTTGNLSVSGTLTVTGAAATGALTVTGTAAISGAVSLASTLGINGVSPPAQNTGWGIPTGGAAVNNFPGAGPATLAQCSTAIAEIILALKSFGLLGA